MHRLFPVVVWPVAFAALFASLGSAFAATDADTGANAPAEPKRPADSARVDGTFVIPADHADVQGVTLKVILYEYNPFLADAGADVLAELDIPKVMHKKGKATTLTFAIGQDKKIRNDRQYYLSARGYRGKEYVYYGKPSHGGIGKVLGKGNPVKVSFTGKRMKP